MWFSVKIVNSNIKNRILLNASDKKRIFQGSDLLKVPGPGSVERKAVYTQRRRESMANPGHLTRR